MDWSIFPSKKRDNCRKMETHSCFWLCFAIMSFLGEHIDGFGKSGGRFGMAFLVFSVSNLVLTLFASIITACIAPAAAGSGIPEVKAYLNGVDAPGIFSLRTLVVKVAIFL